MVMAPLLSMLVVLAIYCLMRRRGGLVLRRRLPMLRTLQGLTRPRQRQHKRCGRLEKWAC